MATTKIRAQRRLMVKAMTMEPRTINGLRRRRRSPDIQPVLNPVDVIGKSGDQSRGSNLIKLCVGKFLYMVKNSLSKLCSKTYNLLCSKILGCDNDLKACSSHKDQQKEIL